MNDHLMSCITVCLRRCLVETHPLLTSQLVNDITINQQQRAPWRIFVFFFSTVEAYGYFAQEIICHWISKKQEQWKNNDINDDIFRNLGFAKLYPISVSGEILLNAFDLSLNSRSDTNIPSVNSLCLSDTKRRKRSMSSSDHVMASCLTAPSH